MSVLTSSSIQFEFLDSILTINLPPKKEDYTLKAFYRGHLVAQLNVDVYAKIKEKITIVPLGEFNLSREEIEKSLRKIYGKINDDFSIKIDPVFKSKVFLCKNPFSVNSPIKLRSTQVSSFRSSNLYIAA